MELATADAVQPHSGEAAFILQLRPPTSGRADTLASELDRFTSLYLERAPGEQVRFTPLGALTWAICAPSDAVDAVDAACDALAETLFGDPASEFVHLARQPDHPRKEDYNIQDQALSDEEGEAVMQDLEAHEWDFATSDSAAGETDEVDGADETMSVEDDGLSSALDDETIDIDAFDTPGSVQEDDDWALDKPIQDSAAEDVDTDFDADADEQTPVEAGAEPDADLDVDLDDDIDLDALANAAMEAADETDPAADADDAMTAEPDAGLDGDEDFELAVSPPSEEPSAPDMDVELSGAESADSEVGPDAMMNVAEEDDPDSADTDLSELELSVAGLADGDDAFEDGAFEIGEPDSEAPDQDSDAPALEGDLALDDFILEDEETRPHNDAIWDEDVDTVDIDDIAASALHETRLGSNLDVAAELNAFREEMRAIARSIPSDGLDATLSDFRAGLESLSGELGQRVDGAAQRIEAAVGQLDVDRYDAASQRVESAASLMETSIQEALEALKRAGAAMSAPTASDILEAQDRETL